MDFKIKLKPKPSKYRQLNYMKLTIGTLEGLNNRKLTIGN